MSCGKKVWGVRYKIFHRGLKTFHGSPWPPSGWTYPPSTDTLSVAGRPAFGRLPERPKGAVCKTVGVAYVGSNPTPATAPDRMDPGLELSHDPVPAPRRWQRASPSPGIPEKQVQGFGVGDLRWSQHHVAGGIHPVIVRG